MCIRDSNNTGNESIVLQNGTSVLIDSLGYTNTWGGGTGGFSLEKINPVGATNQQSNWGTSIDPLKATPLRQNSLTPKQNDLILKSFVISPLQPSAGDSLKLDFVIKNLGLLAASNYTINVYKDLNLDSIGDPSELINTQTFSTTLNQNDSLSYRYGIANIDSGKKQYIGIIVYAPDQDTLNNKLIRSVNVGGQVVSSGLLINEIMYAPTSPEPEWVEVYNNSGAPLNIKNWKISDESSQGTPITITASDRIINTNDYLVISKTNAIVPLHPLLDTSKVIYVSGLPAFNNDFDKVIIFNNASIIVDQVSYRSSWGGSSKYSLERISFTRPSQDSTNWSGSTDNEFSTPTRLNSVTPKQNDLRLKSFIFSPLLPNAGDTLKLDFVIKNIGLLPANNYTLNIYKDINFDSIAQPSELINAQTFSAILNQNDSSTYRFIIANIDSSKKQYIGLVVYTPDEDTLNNKLVRTVYVGGHAVTSGIIINEIMYAPQTPEPEWVEIFNNSSIPINIKNWKIADESSQTTPITITANDRIVNPNDYLVISKSNAIIPLHPLIDSTKILYLSNLPTLNNDIDKVIIINNSNVVVDEVMYRSSWGGSSRNSLERISLLKLSQDSTNWMTSLDCENSTPTRLNSFGSVVLGNRNDLIINEIMFDPLTISSEYVEFYNNSGKYINLNGWKATVGSSSLNLFNGCSFYIKPGAYLVFASDTTLYNRFGNMRGVDSSRIVIFNSSLGLSNSGAMIKVNDVLNNTIDSVYYSPKWHNSNLSDTKGYSLERINVSLPTTLPSNWSSCANPLGGTPGQKNSIFITNNKESSLSVSPNPFSPDGDGHEDFTIIKYKLKANTSQIRVKIFDVKGRIVRSLTNNQFTNSESQIIFDGKDDSGQKLRVGIYVVFLEAVDDMGGTYEQAKTTLVVAAKL